MLSALAAVVVLAAPPARAQNNPRRDAEHYRGRTNGTTPGEGAAWIPRVIFAPITLVTEFGLRRPVVALLQFAEEHRVFQAGNRVANPTIDFSWAPTFEADLGVLTSAGVRARWNHLGFRGHELSSAASTGGIDFLHFRLRDRVTVGPFYFGVFGEYMTRPDRPFYGLGPTSRVENRTNYTQTRIDAMAQAGFANSTHFRMDFAGGYRNENTGPGQAPSIETRFTPQGLDARLSVPGYGLALNLFIGSAQFILDTRRTRTENTGFRFMTSGTYGRDLENANRHWGALELEFEVAVEVMQPDRVLSASLYTMVTQPFGSESVPFTHRAILGHDRLPGFLWGRYNGQSALVGEIAYRYPIWESLDAIWIASAGNVYGEYLADLYTAGLGRMAGSLAVGLRTRMPSRDTFEILAAVGTSRFEDPFSIEGFRLHVGLNPGL